MYPTGTAEPTGEQRVADAMTNIMGQNKTAPAAETGTESKSFLKKAEEKIRQKFGIGSFNDYVGVQKNVVGKLEDEGYFAQGNIQNENSGLIVDITKDGIRETLGKGRRFQTLPKKIKLLKIETLPQLRELIRTAVLIEDNASNIHAPTSRLKYAYLRNTFESDIDGENKAYDMVIVVRKSPQKTNFGCTKFA